MGRENDEGVKEPLLADEEVEIKRKKTKATKTDKKKFQRNLNPHQEDIFSNDTMSDLIELVPGLSKQNLQNYRTTPELNNVVKQRNNTPPIAAPASSARRDPMAQQKPAKQGWYLFNLFSNCWAKTTEISGKVAKSINDKPAYYVTGDRATRDADVDKIGSTPLNLKFSLGISLDKSLTNIYPSIGAVRNRK